jgi:hypothetical protein
MLSAELRAGGIPTHKVVVVTAFIVSSKNRPLPFPTFCLSGEVVDSFNKSRSNYLLLDLKWTQLGWSYQATVESLFRLPSNFLPDRMIMISCEWLTIWNFETVIHLLSHSFLFVQVAGNNDDLINQLVKDVDKITRCLSFPHNTIVRKRRTAFA